MNVIDVHPIKNLLANLCYGYHINKVYQYIHPCSVWYLEGFLFDGPLLLRQLLYCVK